MRVFGLVAVAALVCAIPAARAAVNTTLERPDYDVKRLVPESTSYRMRDVIPKLHMKTEALAETRKLLELDPNEPLTFYMVYRGKRLIALIHGVQFAVSGGPAQVFVVYRLDGRVRDVYLQKMSTPSAPLFRSKYYRQQFTKHGIGNPPDWPYIKPPARVPTNDVLEDNRTLTKAVGFSISIVKLVYKALTG